MKSLLLLGYCSLIFATSSYAEETIGETLEKQKQTDAITRSPTESDTANSGKVVKLTLKEAVGYVIENNLSVKNAKYELIKADSLLLKNESKFAWRASAGAEKFHATLPNNALNVFGGTKQSNDKLSASIEKQFQVGTYVKLEASTVRFDSNAFESQSTSPGLRPLAIGPLYTGAVGITLTQELLKSSFGGVEKNIEKILGTQATIQREEIVFQLSGLVVQVLVDYWSLSIADSAVKTYQKLLENTKNIRDLTRSKQRLGLAEKFETSQWEALTSQVESQLEKAILDRTEIKRKLLRILNVDPSSEVSGLTDLSVEVPKDWSMEKDLDFAYRMRIDLRNIVRQREIAELQLKNAEFDERPSLRVSGSYSTRSQSLISPQENYIDSNRGVTSFLFPELKGEVKLSYPLWDKGIKAAIRDAGVSIEQAKLKEETLRKEIRDELQNRKAAIETGYIVLQKAIKTQEESEKFYEGLISRFRQGRFTAIAVKNALDAVVQSELGVIQAKINFNINLLRYDLAKNYIFEKFGIDVEKEISRIQ